MSSCLENTPKLTAGSVPYVVKCEMRTPSAHVTLMLYAINNLGWGSVALMVVGLKAETKDPEEPLRLDCSGYGATLHGRDYT